MSTLKKKEKQKKKPRPIPKQRNKLGMYILGQVLKHDTTDPNNVIFATKHYKAYQLLIKRRKPAQAAAKILSFSQFQTIMMGKVVRIMTEGGTWWEYKSHVKPLFKAWKGIVFKEPYAPRNQEQFVETISKGIELRERFKNLREKLRVPNKIIPERVSFDFRHDGVTKAVHVDVQFDNAERLVFPNALIKWIGSYLSNNRIDLNDVKNADRWSPVELHLSIGVYEGKGHGRLLPAEEVKERRQKK